MHVNLPYLLIAAVGTLVTVSCATKQAPPAAEPVSVVALRSAPVSTGDCPADEAWLLKPTLPDRVPGTGTDCNFDQLMWQSLIALVQPARGNPEVLEYDTWMPSYGIFVKVPTRDGRPLGDTQFRNMHLAYDALPDDIRKVIDDTSAEFFANWGRWWMETDEEAIEAAKANGNEVIPMSDEARAEWQERLQPVVEARQAALVRALAEVVEQVFEQGTLPGP